MAIHHGVAVNRAMPGLSFVEERAPAWAGAPCQTAVSGNTLVNVIGISPCWLWDGAAALAAGALYCRGIFRERSTGTAATLFCGEPSITRSE